MDEPGGAAEEKKDQHDGGSAKETKEWNWRSKRQATLVPDTKKTAKKKDSEQMNSRLFFDV